jgi:hypothetical protein
MPKPRVVIPVSGVHRGILDAVRFAFSISDNVTAVYIDIEDSPDHDPIARLWKDWFPEVRFIIIPSPDRSIVDPLINFLDRTDLASNDGQQAVLVLPEIITASTLSDDLLHNQSAKLIKDALLHRRRTMGFQRIIIDVPYHLKAGTQK